MILLEKVQSGAKANVRAMLQRRRKRLCEFRSDERTGLAREQQLWIGRSCQRRMRGLECCVDIGGLACDWQLARKRKNRTTALRCR